MSESSKLPALAPVSTYRFQFNHLFTFADATARIAYLSRLGVDWLYASPYLQARPGSLHGYDISNHNRLNPEIGSPEEHAAMVRELRENGMGHLLDIVPNHMGIGQPDNEWWMDVLEHGPSSVYAPYFDIEWHPLQPGLFGKVLLPVLGDQFGRVLEKGELRLAYEDHRFRIRYYDNYYPVSPKSSGLILRAALDRVKKKVGEDDPDRVELESIVTALDHLPPRDRTDPESVAERKRENIVTRRRVAALYDSSAGVRDAVNTTIADFNGQPGHPRSFDQLERLLIDQPYRLAYWRVAAEEINYRRFFDINDLAGVRVERGEVFQATHRMILQLVQEGKVQGLRIDHPDGLYHPGHYLRDLQAECTNRLDGQPAYVVVEKILTGSEELPDRWQVAGTVGYEFLNRLNGLFVDRDSEERMTRVYDAFIGHRFKLDDLVYRKKILILRSALASELNVLANLLDRISEENRRFRDFTLGSLTDALRETIASFPVYRTYVDAHTGDLSLRDREYVDRAIRTAIRRNPATSRTVFEFIRNILLLHWPDELSDESREQHARFVMKFQQLSGPVMAKGLEDTTFYVYNRLASLNEVGGEPERFGVTPSDFHHWVGRRRDHWPLALNTTSTHDTKRSEDVRARINVLSEIPDEWGEAAGGWAELNARHKRSVDDRQMPDSNDEYLLYQSLIGAWPLGELEAEGRTEFVERVQRYMEKATREAKVHTSWINPDEEYDEALREFVAAVLDPARSAEFLESFRPLQERVARIGMLNSLSQTLIKLAAPGVPDIYQGQESWDFSLVDPDNRRPVDYDHREQLLEQVTAAGAEEVEGMLREWRDGRVKLFLTHRLLSYRKQNRELFRTGDYLPLEGRGEGAAHVVAFARRVEGRTMIAVAPRLWHRATGGEGGSGTGALWSGTRLGSQDATLAGRYRNVLTGGEVELRPGEEGVEVPLERVLDRFPVALLERI